MPDLIDLREVAEAACNLHTARDFDALLLVTADVLDAGGYPLAASCLRRADVVARVRAEAEAANVARHERALEEAAETARLLARAEAQEQVGTLLEQAQDLMVKAVRGLGEEDQD